MISSELFALPEGEQAAAGQVDFARDARSLKITASDKAIINYQKFNIGEAEHVQFIQPSSKASVLNRIKGGNPSKILGKLSANGRVYLVNPSGIYFGPHATVNTGSFVASTLNIRDEDFLNGKLHFFQEPGSEKATIVNEGMIAASPEGFVALFAPFIENRGSILAQAGKVVLAAAERVTLDFTGDGLIQFTVDGDLKEALIENYGKIEAAGGAVEISLNVAKKAIKMVVNTDGITPANDIEESDGVIRLVNTGTLLADAVHVDGSKIDAQGTIDVSRENAKGGTVHLLGEQIQLIGAKIDASGALGGGTVLIGGDYQGKGEIRTAQNTVMDAASQIHADAYQIGDGGKVILWSDDTTLFDGKIYARGGAEGGNGGLVETSGKMELGIEKGYVDTSAPQGKFGDWLLDPSAINIVTGGSSTIAQCSAPNCGTGASRTIDPATIAASATNVALCAQQNATSSITVTNAVTMTNPGVSLTLTAGSTNVGTINLNNNITTRGGAINLTGVVVLGANASLDTTNAGGSPAGGGITLSNTVNGARTLTLNGGTGGTVALTGAVGNTAPLTNLVFTNANLIQIGSNITVTGANPLIFSRPVSLAGNSIINSNNANITFNSTLNGAQALTLTGGSGTALFTGAVGGTTSLTSLSATAATVTQTSTVKTTGALSYTGSTAINLGNNITTSGGIITLTGPVTLTGNVVADTTNSGGAPAGANITLTSTVNGGNNLSLTGGTAGVVSYGAVGGATPLTTLTASGATINQNSTVKTTGAVSYTGSTAINVAGNITTSGGIVTMTGPVAISNNPTIDTTNAGGTPAGANISFSSTLNGATALTLRAGTGGNVTFSGAVGNTTPLTNLVFTSANLIQIGNNITVTGANPLIFPSPVSLIGPSTITSNNANITFNSTINGAQPLTILGGTGTTTFTGAVGGITPLASLSVTAGAIVQSSTVNATGGVVYNTGSAIINGNITTSGVPIAITGPIVTTATLFDTTNGGAAPTGADITFSSTLDGATALTLNGGIGGNIILGGAVGGITPLTSLTATGLTVTQNSTAKTIGALSYTGTTAINVKGNITTSGATIAMNGPVTLSNNPTFDTTNGGSVAAGANISFSNKLNGATSLTLRAGTAGNTIFSGAIGGINPLTNLSFTSVNLIQIGDDITVTGANPLIFPSPVQLIGATSNITSNNGNINFNSTIDDNIALTHTLRLIAGSGSITLTGAVGGTTPLGALAIASANNVTANGITVGALSQNAGSGTTTFNGAIATSNILGIDLSGNAFTFNNTVTTTTGGGVTISNAGLLSMPNGSTFTLSGPFAQTGSGPVQIGNTITSNDNILFTGPVALTNAVSISSANHLITFNSTIDSVSTTPFDLTLSAGSSNITIAGNMGSIHPLGAFLVTNANNLTVLGLVANSATINSGTGTITVNGNLLIGSGGINVVGNNFFSNGNVVTTSGGSVTVNNSGTVTRAPGHTTVVDGNYSVIGTGPAFAGSSLTVRGNVLINPAVTLVADAIVDTSGGGGNITFASTINATHDLNLKAGSGNILLSGNVGSIVPIGNFLISNANNVTTQGIQATSIIQTTGTGTTTFNGPLITSGALGISINTNTIIRGAAITTTGGGPLTITNNSGTFTSTAAGAINLGGAFTQNGTGPVSLAGSITTSNATIAFSSPITMGGNVSLNSGTSAGNITLSQGIQGAFDLALNSGTGIITLGGDAGTSLTPLTAFTITNAGNVSTQAIFSSFITQANGSGTTTFNGSLNTTSASGISLTGTAFTFNSPVTTAVGGSVSLTNTGFATFGAGATGSISGALTQTGTGGMQLSSTITAGGAMQFNGPFSVLGSGSLSTQAANQPITFFSTLDGPGNLTLSSGSADILIAGVAGGLSPLGNLIISTVQNLTTQAITASSITQSSVTGLGTTLFNGDLVTSGSGGIQLNGSAFTFVGNASANNPGSIAIANTGLLTTTTGKTLFGAGGFSQTGAGTVNLGSGISATNANISFASPITLTSNVVLNSGTTAGDITVGTVDGNFNLTFTAGRDIFAGVIGGTTRVGTVTATTVRNNHASDITAAAIVQLAGSGTTFLVGNIDTNTPAGINLVGTNFSRSGAIITTNSGSIVVTNSGSITGTSINTTSIDGSYTQIGVGPFDTNSLAGTITARLGISLSSPTTLISDPLNLTPIILDSSGGNGNIVITGTINNNLQAPHTLILRSGSGDATLSGSVGNTAPIGPLILGNIQNFNAAAITAASITQEALATISGQATFNGPIATSGSSGINLTGNAFAFNNNVTTTGGGTVVLANSGPLTISSGSVFNLDGSFTQSGPGPVSFGGSITTTNDAISFAGPISLTVPASLNTGAGAGDITLSGSLDGSSTLSLAAGTGNIAFQGVIGLTTPVAGMTISSATNVLVNVNASLSGPLIFTSVGSQTFNGAVNASAVNLTGGAININNSFNTTSGSIAIANSGTLTVASMSPISSSTSFAQTGSGNVSLGSNITTAGTLAIASPITLTDNVALNSGNGNLTLSSTIAGVFDMTLTAGSGNIILGGNIGAPRLGNFTITSANNISVQAITAASISLLSATGTSTLNGSLDTNTLAGITLIGNTFISNGTITTTNGGPLTVTNSGLVTATGASTITLNGGGAFTQNGTGPVNLGGTLTTQNANISHSSPVTVLLPTTFTSNGGNIIFQNTIDGPACLTLVASAGDVTLNGVVGGTTALGCLNASGATIFQNQSVRTTGVVQETGTTSIRVGGNITTTASDITLTGNTTITASLALSTSGGAGNISFTGTVNGDAAGRNLTVQTGTGDVTLASAIGGSTPFNNLTVSGNNVTWANLGSTVIGATGTTSVTAATDLTFTGTSYNNGTQVYTAGGNFNFTAGVPASINSNALPITFNTGTMQLGATDLSILSNGGNITLTPLLGTGRNLIVNAETGAMNFVQIGASGQNLNNVTLTSNAFTPTPILNTNVFATSLSVNSSTPLIISTNQLINTITYNTPVIFQGNIIYSCGGGGTITFNQSVNANTAGVDTLAFNFSPCTGSLVFNAPVGSVAPLASISIDSATNVTVNSTMNVGSFPITNGTGTVAINSGITSTAAGGISITTPLINLAGAITTASGGPLVLNNSGALTAAPGTSFDISGAFQQTGAGSVSIGGSVVTHDANIQFTGPITLTGTTSLNSHVLTGGNISFASTVQGAQNLTLDAGSGDISFNNTIGTLVTPLVDVQISTAHNVTASAALFAATLTQLAGTGLTSFSALTTTGLNGINLKGNAFTFNGNITTTGSGPVLINNAGTLTFANAVYSIDGALTQSGLGLTNLAGAFTVGRAISFAQGVTLTDTTSLDTSANSENIIFNSTITNDLLGPHDLTFNAGSGNITCVGAIGATQIGALTITNVGTASFNAISAASLLQSAGTGTTTINGNITTSGGSGISLTGTNFDINGTVTTAAAGPFSITNTGPLSLTLGNSTLIDGSFSQSGGGPITLFGTLATNNQNLSFTNDITLAGTTSLSSGSGLGAGTITLSSTVDGNQAFSLNAGTGGDIIFGANLGGVIPLGALTVLSVRNITYPLVNAASIVQGASPGTTIITGPFNTTAILGVSIAGSVINQNGAITTINGGPVAFNTAALTVANGVNTIADGDYSQSGGGTVSLGGSITSTQGTVALDGAVALTADVTIVSGVTSTNGNSISFANAITGAQALTLTAEGGSIVFDADVGTIVTPLTAFTITHADTVSTQGVFANTITQQVGTGLTTFHGALNASTGISLTGSGFTFDSTVTSGGSLILSNAGLATFNAGATGSITGAFTQDGTGGVQLSSAITAGGAVSFTGPFSAVGTGSLDTQAANQPITFFNTINGPGNLTLAAGTGNILFNLDAGSLSPLGALQISSAFNLTTQNIQAASIQSTSSGLALFNGDLNTTGPSGINLTGVDETFLGNLTTTGGGPITLSNTGTLTTTIGKTFSSNGVFTQNGSGNVDLGSAIITTNAIAANANINFSGTSPITLIAPAVFDSSAGGGTINLSAASTVNGNQPVTFTAAAGDINILGDIGGVTRVGALTITSANNIQVQAITASSITQVNGTGNTSLLGKLDTNTPAGMAFNGNNFTAGPAAMSITTTNGGSLNITNQGSIMGTPPLVITIDGSFIQTGPGPVFLGSLTAQQGMSFTGPWVLGADSTLDSSGGNGNIFFGNIVSALAGTENFILNAGSGNITFAQPIGLITTIIVPVTALGSITANGETISINDIGSPSNTGVNGTTSLTALDHIVFTGTTYHANTQIYTAPVDFDMNAGALTTFSTGGNPISFLGGGVIDISAGTDLTINTGGTNLTLGTIHAQPGDHRHLVLNAGAGSIQTGTIGTSGQGEFASASFTGTNLTLGDTIADAMTFNYTGTLNAAGDIISTDTPLTFSNPVVLQGTDTFSTVGTTGADITFSSTLNGAVSDVFGLTLNAGIGNILFSSNVGVPNRLLSLTLGSAGNVTLAPLASMRVDALIQLSGSGTTTFNGPLIVPGVLGILLTGNNFTFNSTVQTLNNASMTIANSGTLNFAGTANLSGAFTQNTTTGPVTLSGSITAGQPISFSGPVTLSGSPSLNTAAANQTITFLNAVGGSGNLTLAAGNGGDITFNANVGSASSHIGAITINSSHNITAQSVFAQSLQLVSSTGLATVNGILNTNGAAGINLIGNNFILNGALMTTGGGSVVVTNSGLITGFASSSRIVDGSYTQNGTGPVNFAGTLTTLNGPISFASLVTLLGPSVFDSSAANQNVTFSSTVDGPSSISINAGGGDVTFAQVVGANRALSSFIVSSAHDITVHGVGTTASGVLGPLNLNASHDINLPSAIYSANSQSYSAGNNINFTAGSQTTLTSFGGPIAFTSGTVHLSNGTNLLVLTNNGDFSFGSIVGTNLEEIIVNTGTGTAALGMISSLGTITDLIVDAGKITFSGPITADHIEFESLTTISNTGAPVLIQTPNTISFNALGGDVGSLSSPILVNTLGQIFAGADGRPDSLADFNGTSADNTVHEIPSNPPCEIIFNNVIIKNCTIPPVPPTPPGPTPAAHKKHKKHRFPFAVPGFDSSFFNLASDYFFLPFYLDERYVRKDVAMYYTRRR